MATPAALNNGIFVGDVQATIGSDLSTLNLLELANKFGTGKRDDMGVIDLWIEAQKVDSPLYQFSSFGGKNVHDVENENGEFTWKTPITNELPFSMGDLDPSNTTKGIDNHKFRVKFNKPFQHTAKISYSKYSGVDLIITQDDIQPTGDGYIHWARLANREKGSHLDNQYLKAGTKWFHASSSAGEFDQKYDGVRAEAGYREYYNFVGNSMATFEYTVGTNAAKMLEAGIDVKTGKLDLVGMWKVNDQNLKDPSITNLNQLKGALGGQKGLMKAVGEQRLDFGLITKIEAKGLSKIANDIEYDLMWGKGGIIETDGPDVLRESMGLWMQMDNAPVVTYNKSTFTLDMFKNELHNHYQGRIDLVGPDPKRTIIVQSGKAGIEMATGAIERKAFGQGGLMTQSTEIGAISGSAMELHYGFSFTSFTIPFIANVKFVYNPALDPIHDNDIDNPIIDGYRLSSYSFIIFDITEQGSDNIMLMRKKYDHELSWRYENGKRDRMGKTSGFQSSGGNFGYKVMMEQSKKGLWLKDASQVLKMVMVNPRTGKHL